MDTTQIKAYAPQARKDFINAVTQRAARFGIHGDGNFDPVEFKGDTAIIGSQVFTKKGGELRERLVAKVKQTGFEMFIRSSAYTWFNRFVAIRYMELHDFLDHGFRVLSNPNGSDIPEILEHATEVDLPGLDREKVLELRLAGDKDNELYRMLVIAQCNALHKAMPFLFDRIDNEAELLLPDNLLHTNSPVKRMVSQIDETLWDDVEIIGWIYQFYISEKKEEVIGKVVKSEDIPAATQWFTPNWIVKYMVQNTLGRMWMATYPESSLKSKMEYYIEPAEQEPDVQAEIDATTPKELNPEELTFLDPACGSGHILVEAYDILKEIYLERGYRTRDIPRLILSKNIYGLDIDDRAAQLACFAVLMRARKDDRRLFSRDDLVLNVMAINESNKNDTVYIENLLPGNEYLNIRSVLKELIKLFENGKTLGSLISIPENIVNTIGEVKNIIDKKLQNWIQHSEIQILRKLANQCWILSKKFDCVVLNPPYMGGKGMNQRLKDYAKVKFPNSKTDLFSIFIERSLSLSKKQQFLGMITMQSWMFLMTFEDLRKTLILKNTIASMMHLGPRAFDSIGGEVVSTTSFILINRHYPDYQAKYFRLADGNSEFEKKAELRKSISKLNDKMNIKNFFLASVANFMQIPGNPIAYWATAKVIEIFKNYDMLGSLFNAKAGMKTGSNELFLRFWYEIEFNKLNLYPKEMPSSPKRWFLYSKGGDFRKWYGNVEHVVDWANNGDKIKNFSKNGKINSRVRDLNNYFQDCISWSFISSSGFASRFKSSGIFFDMAGSCVFPNKHDLPFLLGFLCSKLSSSFLKILNPTLNFQVNDIMQLPINRDVKGIDYIISELIEISKSDWDSYETSVDFERPLIISPINKSSTVKKSFSNYYCFSKNKTNRMQKLEVDNNLKFIEAYNLKNELSPDIPVSEITLAGNPNYRYGEGRSQEELETLLQTDTIKELISYSLGCMVGRYSLDQPGLIFADNDNNNFDSLKYKSFPADDDGIIPIMDMNWFEDDATKRFIEFIKTAWPQEHRDENLKFVADSLSPKTNESPEDTIRRYLSTTFFKDHMKMYKKRPIYWLFSSGKQKAFECLVYLHRYNESTLSRMRSNYVTPLQGNISARIEFLEHEKDAASTPSAQKKIQKQIDVLKKKQMELKTFDDELRHYADMKISLDLDDGVKVNYGKFGNLLAEKKAITG